MENKKPEKISGWLLFFTIIFGYSMAKCFLSVIYMSIYPYILENLSLQLPQLNRTVIISNITTSSILFILYLFTFITLIGKKAIAKKLAIISTWIGFALSIVSLFIGYAFLEESLASLGLTQNYALTNKLFLLQAGFSILVGLAWAIVLTVYFVKSERVKKTLINKI